MVIGNCWDELLKDEYAKPYFTKLIASVDEEYARHTVFPPYELIFRAMQIVDYNNVKVLILGQDPYHGDNQANGMAFAVNDGIALPPSLINIYKEIESDIGCAMPKTGSLTGWAKQGVLLLNTVLSVRKATPQSHASLGWQTFTDAIIAALSARREPLAFILWGANAIAKKPLIPDRHLTLTSPHPSPLSAHRGFFGSKPFSKVNKFLAEQGKISVDWSDVDGIECADYYSAAGKIYRV